MTDRSTGDEWSKGKVLGSGLSVVLTISCILRPLIRFNKNAFEYGSSGTSNTAAIFSILMIPLAAYPIYYTLLSFSSRGVSFFFFGLYEFLAILTFSVSFSSINS